MTPLHEANNDITFFATTNFRESQIPFGIRAKDRRSHIFSVGRTGTGKTTLLETFIRSDLQAGRGLALLDPHGDLIEKLLPRIPPERQADLIYFNVPDAAQTLGFNPLEHISPGKRSLAAAGLLEVFKKLWPEFWGPRSEHILRNAILALLDYPTANLGDVLTVQ